MKKLLVANRGEIAIRILRAAADLGLETVAVYSSDDAQALHVRRADEAVALGAKGVAAYLDIDRIVAVATETGADAIHPGYGFLAENDRFAEACAKAGITFVGPNPAALRLFGDKVAARAAAKAAGVPVLKGTDGPVDAATAAEFLAGLGDGGAMVIKAVAGGGGRGMRIVRAGDDVAALHASASAEALSAFGDGRVYCEEMIVRARHIEIQVLGDASGAASHLWERECSVQRRHQKVIEVAPSPTLDPAVRRQIVDSAVGLAKSGGYDNIGTFEFLLDATDGKRFAFIEANPRLQVEHTVTEEVTGVDIVRTQIRIAAGATLAELGLGGADVPAPRGHAIQLRVNMETMAPDGSTRPGGGTLAAFEPPSGPGIRVDTFGYAGFRTSPAFDSLLAKVIVHDAGGTWADAVRKAYRALAEFRIEGVPTNIGFLQNLLAHTAFAANDIYTRFVEDHIGELAVEGEHRKLFFENRTEKRRAGVKIDAVDPLALFAVGQAARAAKDEVTEPAAGAEDGGDGATAVRAPMQGTIVSIAVEPGDAVPAGKIIAVMDAMKMQHDIVAEVGGTVRMLSVEAGDTVFEGDALLFIEEGDVAADTGGTEEEIDLDYIRPDLQELLDRREVTLDRARPGAVARRRKHNQRTSRENVEDFCDPGTFMEYGQLVIAGRRLRTPEDELIRDTPADGMLAGIGHVNGDLVGEENSRCAVLSYDYTVLAGTQGMRNHEKKDRLFEIAERQKLPVVFFAEGGGGRPGDTDLLSVGGLNVMAFNLWGKLSGLVPMVGITSRYCYAGNAAILGCCDVIIATKNSNIGMGGPAMVEGGNLGVFTPEEIGPVSDQYPNGVIDILVEDEAEAVKAARKYVSYFQGPVKEWSCADQRLLRRAIPENRLKVYDIRKLIETMLDTDSMLEIRRGFGPGMVTCFGRVEGRPIGIVANNPAHLAGAIDTPGADKAARFLQLCDAFDIPVLFLIDTPGMMVGPEVEKTALVRHCCRLFVIGANLTVPFFSIVLRKSYGLGAQAMAGGSFLAPLFTIAWPTGEFGGMGLEGQVKLGYRKELLAIEDPVERKKEFDRMVAEAYARGKAISTASYHEIDDVIDPAETRQRIVGVLKSCPPPAPRTHKKRPNVDTW